MLRADVQQVELIPVDRLALHKPVKDINTPNSIHQGDCLELIQGIRPQSIDFAFADLPYNVTRAKWDKEVINLTKLWEHLNRICKSNAAIVFTATQPFASKVVMSNLEHFKYEWIWEKPNGTGGLNVLKQPMRCHEHVLVFYKQQCTYNPIKTSGHPRKTTYRKSEAKELWNDDSKPSIYDSSERFPRSVQVISSDKQQERDFKHPTRKPLALMEYLIKTYTKEGDLILDPTCGSGTTAIAAMNLNRNYICIEKDSKCYQTTLKRINSVQKGNK